MSSKENPLNIVFKVKQDLLIEKDEHGIVTICERQDHLIQRFFRKLHVHIPQYRKITLDEIGSFVFLQIDGVRSVGEIGKNLEEAFGEKVSPVYERLLQYLEYVNKKRHYIERVQ